MSPHSFEITLSELSDRERETAAADLERTIKTADDHAVIDRKQDNRTAMDFGASLAVVLSSGAAIAVARGIQAWMHRWQTAKLTFSDGHRSVQLEGLGSTEVIRALELLTTSQT